MVRFRDQISKIKEPNHLNKDSKPKGLEKKDQMNNLKAQKQNLKVLSAERRLTQRELLMSRKKLES
jgi:hypothetical protein